MTTLNEEELRSACRNIGFDLECGACAQLFYTGHGGAKHDEDCMTRDEAKSYAEVLDDIRDALGQTSTHYLVTADDIEELVQAVEKDNGSAMVVLRKLRNEPRSGNPKCQACSIEAEIGTEEDPHPVPRRFHRCVPSYIPPSRTAQEMLDTGLRSAREKPAVDLGDFSQYANDDHPNRKMIELSRLRVYVLAHGWACLSAKQHGAEIGDLTPGAPRVNVEFDGGGVFLVNPDLIRAFYVAHSNS